MRAFRLTDAAFAELAAGRPSAATVAELRRAQISRHLLLLGETRKLPNSKIPFWYATRAPDAAETPLADPMIALHTAATLDALRSGTPPPPDHVASPHELAVTHHGLTLRARLEDTDPLRSRLGLTPSRQLTAPEVAGWHGLLDDAWRLLVTRHRPAAEILAAVLRVLVPIEPDAGSAGLSATSSEAFGAVALSTPADATSLAVGLLHETQHSLLNATRTLFDLVTPDAPALYSPWRDDPRPPFGLLHGAYAYQAVTRFWRTEAATRRRPPNDDEDSGSSRPLAEFEFARWRAAVAGAADALLGGGWLTMAGRRFVRALRDEVGAWLGEPVDGEIERLARGANVEHRVRWRLRNLTVDVGPLVEAWHEGRPPVLPEPVLRPGGGRALERSDRLDLIHRTLRGAGDQRPDSRGRPGDTAWLRGEAGTALDAYVKDWESSREIDAWAGIALVAPWACVRERPEVVTAVQAKLGNVSLDKIAIWLERVLNSSPR